MKESRLDLKGEMSLLNVLLLHSLDLDAVAESLAEKCRVAGQLLNRSPIIVDCSSLAERCESLDFVQLKSLIAAVGLVPVGLRHLPEDCEMQAQAAGWAILRATRTAGAVADQAVTTHNDVATKATDNEYLLSEEAAAIVSRLLVIERPVRSGQQIYFPAGDIVVMQQTSAGSELLAGGSVHVYGVLRGRVLAGVQGDMSARIFCQRLEAELIAIAGRYRLLDELDATLRGQAVMVYLEGEKLKIVPI